MKQKLLWLIGTKLGRLMTFVILAFVFFNIPASQTIVIGNTVFSWSQLIGLICMIYPIGLTLVMIGYAIRNTFKK